MEIERHTPQDERLSQALEALAYPLRLALLRQLRQPKVLKEIRVAPGSAGGARRRDRPVSRQAVKEHLERLLDAGVVTARETEREYGTTVEYVVDHQALFAIGEQFRELARLRPVEQPDGETMMGTKTGEELHRVRGPCLVLVKGLDEGQTFDLDPGAIGARSWTIGRSRSAGISLDFDPFVSSENARVRLQGDQYLIEDLPASRNGTTLNFVALDEGEPQEVRHGDLIGVGRSLLEFWE